ncbi:MAG: AraC family transcriptional regulator [Clostridium sp.]|nr:AraC family transcriptional regulator [Clostridium sp.]
MNTKHRDNSPAPRQGYLSGDYRLFHLTDRGPGDYEPHYHDFCKILLLISGSVDYIVEGRTYELRPGDMVLVNRGEIHCPHVKDDQDYERVILYLSPAFLQEYSLPDPLDQCFRTAQYRHSSVLRPGDGDRASLLTTLEALERAIDRPEEFAGPLYGRVLLLEFLIFLNRAALDTQTAYLHTGAMDYRVSGLISYINEHLGEELSIDRLSKECCLSPYHMMRLFRQETGCTIGNYIAQKRLAFARELIISGRESATSACFAAGFSNYSTFLRAYKLQFGSTPRDTRSGCASPKKRG